VVNQADRFGLRRIDEVPGQDQLHGFSFPDQSCQALSASSAGNYAEINFRLAQLRVITREPKITCQSKLHPAPEAETVDHGDHRFRKIFNSIENALSCHGVALSERRAPFEFADVCACDKSFVACSGHDQHVRVRHRLERIQSMEDFIPSLLVQRISLIGTVNGEGRNAVVGLEENVLIYHAWSHYMETPGELIPIKFLPALVDVEQRADGTLVLRSPEPLRPAARCLGEYLERWAAERPNELFLAPRSGNAWRTVTWSEARRQVHAIATSLLARGVSVDHPVAVLSENSIEHG